jgi:hypothetical protein
MRFSLRSFLLALFVLTLAASHLLIREREWRAKADAPIPPTAPNPSYGMLLWVEAH